MEGCIAPRRLEAISDLHSTSVYLQTIHDHELADSSSSKETSTLPNLAQESVFRIPELMESIFLLSAHRSHFSPARVCRGWKLICDGAPKIRRARCLMKYAVLRRVFANLSMKDLLQARNVCLAWKLSIEGSTLLQQKLFLQAQPRFVKPDGSRPRLIRLNPALCGKYDSEPLDVTLHMCFTYIGHHSRSATSQPACSREEMRRFHRQGFVTQPPSTTIRFNHGNDRDGDVSFIGSPDGPGLTVEQCHKLCREISRGRDFRLEFFMQGEVPFDYDVETSLIV